MHTVSWELKGQACRGTGRALGTQVKATQTRSYDLSPGIVLGIMNLGGGKACKCQGWLCPETSEGIPGPTLGH